MSTWELMEKFSETALLLAILAEEEQAAVNPDVSILTACEELIDFYTALARETYNDFLRDA